jgi:hypothetical protein
LNIILYGTLSLNIRYILKFLNLNENKYKDISQIKTYP